ncbi:hypothetical protein HanIR_Chr10g0494601 [Helianthus annuus]|nr:hypothetical protein HanIR_Chr10g0494601 [Helianthus annuus]
MSSNIIPSLGMNFSGNAHHSPHHHSPHPTIFPHNQQFSSPPNTTSCVIYITRFHFEWRWYITSYISSSRGKTHPPGSPYRRRYIIRSIEEPNAKQRMYRLVLVLVFYVSDSRVMLN